LDFDARLEAILLIGLRGTEAKQGPGGLFSGQKTSSAVRRRLLAGAALLGAGLLVLAGCQGGSPSPGAPAAGGGQKKLDAVRFRMSWLPSSEYAGIISAVNNGYYRDQGIDCRIDPGGVGFPPLQLVASGADEFGLVGGDTLLVGRSRGIPVRAIATEFQASPQVFFARKSSGITSPLQFPGHTVGIKVGKTAETMYRAMIGSLHINPNSIKTVPIRAGMQEFYAGKVDVWPGFIFDEAADAEAHGIPINIIHPEQYGVKLYSDAIFTTDQMISSKPDLVKRFLTATQKGWEWAGDHPDQALQIVLKTYPDLDPVHEKVRLAGSLPLIVGSPSHGVRPIGKMDPAVWKSTYDMLNSQHLLKGNFPLQDAYTLQFLK
jgi:NitT/TauT family transport system substrate-binding protein